MSGLIRKKKRQLMSQVAQAPQKFTLPGMHRRTTPAPTIEARAGRTRLHLPALVFMIALTQIPFLLAVWFSLHSWNLLVSPEGFPFVGLTYYITELVSDPNFWPVMWNT